MSESVVLIGGGGHAKVVIDCIRACGDIAVGILDDGISVGTEILGVPVIGRIAQYPQYTGHSFLIAIGNNAVRRRIAETVKVKWHTLVHPLAFVSPHASIGEGSVVFPHAVVNAGASVGAHCILNTGSITEHDNRLADFVHISPRTALGGSVSVGAETHIGIGAVVRNNIDICGGCVIGAGAVVVKNITESGVYVGVPAHRK